MKLTQQALRQCFLFFYDFFVTVFINIIMYQTTHLKEQNSVGVNQNLIMLMHTKNLWNIIFWKSWLNAFIWPCNKQHHLMDLFSIQSAGTLVFHLLDCSFSITMSSLIDPSSCWTAINSSSSSTKSLNKLIFEQLVGKHEKKSFFFSSSSKCKLYQSVNFKENLTFQKKIILILSK